VPEAVLVVGDR